MSFLDRIAAVGSVGGKLRAGFGFDRGGFVEPDHGRSGDTPAPVRLTARGARAKGTGMIVQLVNGVVHLAAPSPEATLLILSAD
ncbi:hypothetical protein BBta_6000 [Bradyrhizobium sp. BTAi1]|nr:hypothetical protein BBta_6000 [Bradyrhizobium sp. BTAi1]